MSKQKAHAKKHDPARENIINQVMPILNTALANLKATLGEKKFEKRVRKAAKILAHGIKTKPARKPTAPKKIAAVPKKAVKKVVKKAVNRRKAPVKAAKAAVKK